MKDRPDPRTFVDFFKETWKIFLKVNFILTTYFFLENAQNGVRVFEKFFTKK